MKRKRKEIYRLEHCSESQTYHLSERIRSRKVQRLCVSFDVDPFVGGFIVELLERMEEMQRDLDRLRR